MPKFLMFIEESTTTVRRKEFEAEDMEEAIGLVEAEDWREDNDWEVDYSDSTASIRKDICYALAENPREKGDDDGVEYGHPLDALDDLLED